MANQDNAEDAVSAETCPLAAAAQRLNLALIGIIFALNYLCTPTTYVWVHTPLCAKLGANATLANLPTTAYFILAVTPLFVAWYFPSPAQFKPILIASNGLFAAACGVVVATLVLPCPDELKIAVLIAHGGIAGATMTTSAIILFEIMGRGIDASRRGQALALAYGVGPIFAVMASLASQYVLPEKGAGVVGAGLEFPWNYVVVFAASVPIMTLIAVLCSRFVLPPGEVVVARQPLWNEFSGTLRDFFLSPVLRRVSILSILMFAGYLILDNMMLYSKEIFQEDTEKSLGWQHTFRYTFKILSGFLLGALLTRTNPKLVLLVSASFGLGGVMWALLSSAQWYLVSFGWLGAGELFGPYVTNYILACSPPAQMRRNMAYSVLLLFFAAPAGPLFGGVADYVGKEYTRAAGFQLSFVVAAAFIVLALLMMLPLPVRPRPDDS